MPPTLAFIRSVDNTYAMDRTKLLMILSVFVVLLVVFMLFRALIGGNESDETTLQNALRAQTTIVELSQTAVDKSNSPSLQAQAARIMSTAASDLYQLSDYYQVEIGRLSVESDFEALSELEAANENLDQAYIELVREQLEISYAHLTSLKSPNDNLRTTIEMALENHQTHLDQLKP